jgi:hypothetical protein
MRIPRAPRTQLLRNAATRVAHWSDWAFRTPIPPAVEGSTPLEACHSEQLHKIARLIELGQYDAALTETMQGHVRHE